MKYLIDLYDFVGYQNIAKDKKSIDSNDSLVSKYFGFDLYKKEIFQQTNR